MKQHVKKLKKLHKRVSPLHIIIIVVIASVLTYVLARSFAATGTAAFTIEPTTASVIQGATHEVRVYVTPSGSALKSAQISVNFPAHLQYQSFDSSGGSFNLTSPVAGDTVGSTKVTVIAGYTGTNSGASGTKLYIGKFITTATSTLGTGTITLSDQSAQDPAEAYMTSSVQSASVTVSPPPKPDLVVTAITSTPSSPAPGAAVSFTAAVKNQGNLATTAGVVHSVKFVVDGTTQVISNTYTTSIAAGATVNISSNAGSTWTATVGTHSIAATVDDSNLISESNEANNQFSGSVTVADTTAPTVSYAFPGASANEVLSGGVITIASLTQPVVRPIVTDNVGVTSAVYKLNTTTITLTSGQYTLPNQNGNYTFNVTASDAAANSLNNTITVRSRSPDIVRDGRVNNPDFVRLLTRWGTADAETDLDTNGTVGQGDFTKLLIAWTN